MSELSVNGSVSAESPNRSVTPAEQAGAAAYPVTAPAAPELDSEYNADSFSVLEGIAHVRKNPSMYVGGADERGLHHLIWEVVDNSIDEAMAGHCRVISVSLAPDGSVSVADDGRGIPVDINSKIGKTGLEIALTKVGGGAKHDNRIYKTSGGLHGMGLSCVNALARWLEAEVIRGGTRYRFRCERGEPKSEVEPVGPSPGSGTRITFLPDWEEIFVARGEMEAPVLKAEVIAARLKQHAYLNAGVTIHFEDQRISRRETYHYSDGIRDFVRELVVGREVVTPEVMHFVKQDNASGIKAAVAMSWTDDSQETFHSFANSIHTPQGGTHLSGFRKALTRAVKGYMEREGHFKDPKDRDGILGEDVQEGLVAVVSVHLPGRTFSGQEKAALTSPEAGGYVESMLYEQLSNYLNEHPREAGLIVKRVKQAAEGRRAAQRARELAKKSAGKGLPAKLADCSTRDRMTAELFLVEGDSAGGSAKQGRDSETQAVLRLRGKILNVEKARLDKMLGHEEIQALINSIGTGIGVTTGDRDGSDMDFNLGKLRYGKVIIMTDADVDGSHIRTLLLTFFFRHMPLLIEAGRIFVAQPPLYGFKKGKTMQYVLNERRLRDTLRDQVLEDTTLIVKPALSSLPGGAALATTGANLSGALGSQPPPSGVPPLAVSAMVSAGTVTLTAPPEGQTPAGQMCGIEPPQRRITGAALRELLRLLDAISAAAEVVGRRGRLWPRFLAENWNPALWFSQRRLLPTHLLAWDRDECLLFDDHEVAAKVVALRQVALTEGRPFTLTGDTLASETLPVEISPEPVPQPVMMSPTPAPQTANHGQAGQASASASPADPFVDAPLVAPLIARHTILKECRQLNELFARLYEWEGLGLTAEDYLHEQRETITGELEASRLGLQRGAAERITEVANLADLPGALDKLASRGFEIKRYKGLGEMNPDELRLTTMEPANRTLLRVSIENAIEAERLFSTLMGKETESRREYIEEHALEVRHLDV